jgi:hypothetical protein
MGEIDVMLNSGKIPGMNPNKDAYITRLPLGRANRPVREFEI